MRHDMTAISRATSTPPRDSNVTRASRLISVSYADMPAAQNACRPTQLTARNTACGVSRMRDAVGTTVIGVCALLLILAVAGCATGPRERAYVQPRSMVFNSARMQRLEHRQPTSDATPWYATRNDSGPQVIAGVESRRFERVIERTHDRRFHHDGHVHDRYYRNIHRQEVYERVR